MIETLNHVAGAWWWSWVGPMLWQVALLALIVWAVDILLLRRRAWPQVRYALWLLVLLRLFIPPSFSLPSSVSARLLPAGAPRASPVVAAAPMAAADLATPLLPEVAPTVEPAPVAYSPAVSEAAPVTFQPAEMPAPPRAVLSVQAWAMLLSSGVSLLLLVWLASRASRLGRVTRGSGEGAPDWLREVLARCAGKLRLRRLPRLVVSGHVRSAAVFGVFRPVLLLPARALAGASPGQMEHILLHELAHVKRGDLLANAAQTVVHILFWFHPGVWLAGRRLRHLRELCCDATVSRLLRERTDQYRATLMEAARTMVFGKTEPGLGLLGLFESASRLRQRLQHLERPAWKHARLKLVASLGAVALMLACIVPMAKGRDAPENRQRVSIAAEAGQPRQVGVETQLAPSENAYNPIPSPDGSLIAYLRTGWGLPGYDVGTGRSSLGSEVMLISADGRKLTQEPLVRAFLSGWTPDGMVLTCYRGRRVYLVSMPEGALLRKVELPRERETGAERIAYLHGSGEIVRTGSVGGTYTYGLWSGGRLITPASPSRPRSGPGRVLAPSPDGRYVAAASPYGHLWTYDLKLRKWHDLSPAIIHPASREWDYYKPSWDPWFRDGSKLVFVRGNTVVVSTPDGEGLDVIATLDAPCGLATASPNGKRIAVATFVARPRDLSPDLEFWGDARVWVMPCRPGAQPVAITLPNKDTVFTLRWLDNGTIVFDRLSKLGMDMSGRLWKVSVPPELPASGANSKDTAWGEAVEGLRTRLVSDRAVYEEGQNVFLYLDVYNAGDEAISVAYGADVKKRLHLVDAAGEVVDPRPPRGSGIYGRSVSPARQSELLSFYVSGNQYAMFEPLKPGMYRAVWSPPVDATAKGMRLGPLTDAVTFEVVPKTARPQVPDSQVADVAWGEEQDGLRTRIRSGRNKFYVGQPIPVTVELMNASEEVKRYHVPHVLADGGVVIIHEGGEYVPYIGGSFQINNPERELNPGETHLLDSLDLGAYYYLGRPGRYVAYFPGGKTFDTETPKSNTFGFQIVVDPTAVRAPAPIARLLPLIEDRWQISARPSMSRLMRPSGEWGRVPGRRIGLWHRLPGGKWDAAFFTIWLADEPAPIEPWMRREGDPSSAEYLGKVARWHVYLLARGEALERWPTVKEDIRRALAAEPKPPSHAAEEEVYNRLVTEYREHIRRAVAQYQEEHDGATYDSVDDLAPYFEEKAVFEKIRPALTWARTEAQRNVLKSHVLMIVLAIREYARDHQGTLPPGLDYLQPYLKPNRLESLSFRQHRPCYVVPSSDDPDEAVAYYWPPFNGGTYVGYRNGDVDWVEVGQDGSLINPRRGAPIREAAAEKTGEVTTDPEDVPWSEAVEGLRWRAWIEPEELEIGGSLRVHMQFQNVSDKPLRMYEEISVGKGLGPVWRTSEGREHSFDTAWPWDQAIPLEETVALGAGATRQAEWVMDWTETRNLSPGVTLLRMSYFSPNSTNPDVRNFWSGRLAAEITFVAVPPKTETVAARVTDGEGTKWLDGHKWSRSSDGLQTRLTAASRRFPAGRPIAMRLELRNVGDRPIRYYHATGYWPGDIRVTGPDGEDLPWLAGPVSTESGGPTIKPDARVILDEFDLSAYYYVRTPGHYTVSYRGHQSAYGSQLPPSPPFAIEVVPDPAAQADGDPVGRLLAGLPKDWSLRGSTGGAGRRYLHPGLGWSRVRGSPNPHYS